MNSKLTTIFLGSDNFAVTILENLKINKDLEIKAVITQPDKEAGRKKELTPPPVKIFVLKNNWPIYQPEKIKDPDFVKQLAKIKPDLIIVAAYGQLLSETIINLPKFGCLNIHASLLPKYRGASPIQAALMNGDSETGVTLMKMDKGMDTGAIIAQDKIKIDSSDNYFTLEKKLADLGANLLTKTLPLYIKNQIEIKPQDNNKASYVKILTKADGLINFNQPAKTIEAKWRALINWPGIFCEWQGKKIKLLKIKIDEQLNPLLPVGQLYSAENKLVVNCAEDALILEEVQLEGKNPVPGKDFINGYLK